MPDRFFTTHTQNKNTDIMKIFMKYRKMLAVVAAIASCTMAHADEVTAASTLAEDNSVSINTVWMLVAAMLVFFMQPGFALCEAGFTRSKNTANILMKNFCDFIIGTIVFWFVGFGLMHGSGDFVGMPNFGSLDFWKSDDGLPVEGFLIFQTVFCATAATIVSGCMAERTKFSMYLVYSFFISLIIYPVEGHWTWGGGWLCNDAADGFMMSTFGAAFHDFAGSTIVHYVGGLLGLVGAAFLGARRGKYTADGRSRAIPGHNLTYAALGVWILWFGWFGFNPGSQLAATGEVNRFEISLVFVNTNLAAAMGGLATIALSWIKYGKPSLSLACNGILAGLVGITAGCDCVNEWGAAVIGLVSGVAMVLAVEFIDTKLKIDDPVGAVSVHGVSGFLGTLCVGLFSTGANGVAPGLFYGGGASLLGAELCGLVAVGAWTVLTGVILFYSIKKIHGLRVDKRIEDEGLDIYEHGEEAYN